MGYTCFISLLIVFEVIKLDMRIEQCFTRVALRNHLFIWEPQLPERLAQNLGGEAL